MLGVVLEIGTSVLRLWVAAGAAVLFVIVCALAFGWTRTKNVVRISIVVLGAVLGATLAWVFLDAASKRDHDAERVALERRAAELNGQALTPGSALACLDGLAGEKVESACEKAIFATPASVASATSYVAERFALLAAMAAYAKHGGTGLDNTLLSLRRSLEADRFGFLAHTLAARDGCTSQNCAALAVLQNPSRVRANLNGETLDRYLEHYLTVWNQPPDSPVADAAVPQPAAASQPGQHKVSVNIDFPSAASIPPISIMNPEPKGPVTATGPASVAAGAQGGDQNTAAASSTAAKRSHKPPTNAPAQAATAAPPAAAASPVDPVWTPATAPAAPAAPQATATAAPPGGPAPVQLNPSQVQPEASAGGAPRAQ